MKPNIILFILLSILLTVGCQAQLARQEAELPATSPATSARPGPTTMPASPTVSRPARATAAPTPTRPTPTAGGAIVLGLVGQLPRSLNPVTEIDPAVRHLSPLLYDSLLRVDPKTAQLQPGLAQSWNYSDDGRRVTFKLPANLAWSDGTPLTAADIAHSLQATQHPALLTFSAVEAPDDQTLTLTFLTIDCSAVTTVGLLPLLPAQQVLEPRPVGSGPFVVAGQPDDPRTLKLNRNPRYHGAVPYLDGLTIRFLANDEVDLALSEGAAQFDVVGPLPGAVRPVSRFRQMTYPAAQLVYLAINEAPRNEAPLSPAVRQALQVALDREAILTELLNSDGQLLAGPLLPGHWAAADNLSGPGYAPERARALLREAGWQDTDGDGWLDQAGERLELAIRLNGANPLHQRLGWLVSGYYRSLGLYSRAESVPPDSLIDNLFTHDFRLAIFNRPSLPDPDQRLTWHSTENEAGVGLNFMSYSDPAIDRLLEQGVSTPGCQPEQRAGFYREFQETLSQEGPVDLLLAPNQHVLVIEQLAGLDPGPFAPFTWNAGQWYLGGDE